MAECESEKKSCGPDMLNLACKREFQVKTVFDSTSYRFKWNVEGYSKIPPSTLIDSPEFKPMEELLFKGQLEKGALQQRNRTSGSKLIVKMTKISGSSNTLRVRFECKIETGDAVIVSVIKSNTYDSTNKDFVICEVDATLLADLPDNSLFIDVLMEIYHPTFQTEVLDLDLRESSEITNLRGLSDDLKLMYGVSLYTDMSLQVGSATVTTHKAILCSRSPVFKKMFESSLDESDTNTIVIRDLELATLKNLLSFLYTEQLADENFNALVEVYYAADKYDVPSLRKLCAELLKSKLKVANSCQVMELADRHCDKELKNSVMQFVLFHFYSVLETDTWDDLVLRNASLASEVMSLRSKRRKQQAAAVHVQGQEPLTSSMLADASAKEQKQMLGERLFSVIYRWYPDIAGKITGMLLELDNAELLHMLENHESLRAKVEEAVAVLQAHNAKEMLAKNPVKEKDKETKSMQPSPVKIKKNFKKYQKI